MRGKRTGVGPLKAPRRLNPGALKGLIQACQRLGATLDTLVAADGAVDPKSSGVRYRPDLDAVHARLQQEMGTSPDVVIRWVEVPALRTGKVLVAYIDGLVDNQMLDQDIIGRLEAATAPPRTWDTTTLRAGHVTAVGDWHGILRKLASGQTIVFAPGLPHVWAVDTVKFNQRAIARPETELSVRGPMEAFNEVLLTQMSQLRRRFPTPDLEFHQVEVGSQQGLVVVASLRGITNQALLKMVIERLRRVKLEARPSATAIAGLIRDHPRSIFPTIRSTERVDVAAWHLAEGKIVILVDGDPFVLIAPAPLADFYRTAMDYSGGWQDASFVRLVRFAGWAIGVYLPAFYIAVTDINSNVMPAGLLIVIEGSRAGLPVHPLSEVLLMIFTIEILREAALRLPKVLATTIGTVGAIVVGTAIVKAGIVSPQIIVLITLTALAFYSAPVYELTSTWRLVNFAMLAGAALFGLLGIVAVTLWLIGELSRLNSFGTPYFEPWAPFRAADWEDILIRLPWASFRHRPTTARPEDVSWPRSPSRPPVHLRRNRP